MRSTWIARKRNLEHAGPTASARYHERERIEQPLQTDQCAAACDGGTRQSRLCERDIP